MMGRTHALTGAVAGLAVAPLAGTSTVAQTVVFAVTTAGWAIVPDLDHPNVSASRVLGPITAVLSWIVRTLSSLIYKATKGPRDEAGIHRTVTHTALFAVLVGVGLGWAGTASLWVVAGVAAVGVLLAADRLGDIVLAITAVAALLLTAGIGTNPDTLLAEISGLSWTVGIAAGLGCLVHTVGDMITESGAPLLFPLPIAGETYYEVRPPSLLRFSTNSVVENAVITPLCLLALVGLSIWTATSTSIA